MEDIRFFELKDVIKLLIWVDNHKDKVVAINLDCELLVPYEDTEIVLILSNGIRIAFYNELFTICKDKDGTEIKELYYKDENFEEILEKLLTK